MKRFVAWVLLCLCVLLAGCQHFGGIDSIGFNIKLREGTVPSFAEIQKEPKQVDFTLIKGEPVPKGDLSYAPVVMIKSASGAGCTGTVIGPRTLITAAHCAKTSEKISFKTLGGKLIEGVAERASQYREDGSGLDINLIYLNQDAPDMISVKLDNFERIGMTLQLVGYGCINQGGGGGNDGILRVGPTIIQKAVDYSLVTSGAKGAALCFGDSGGPVLWPETGKPKFVMAINSRGNIADTSYIDRLTQRVDKNGALLPHDAKNFMLAYANKNKTGICGLNLSCNGETPAEPPAPGPQCTPKQFYVNNELIEQQLVIKCPK